MKKTDHYKQHGNKMDSLEEMDQLLEMYNLLKTEPERNRKILTDQYQ